MTEINADEVLYTEVKPLPTSGWIAWARPKSGGIWGMIYVRYENRNYALLPEPLAKSKEDLTESARRLFANMEFEMKFLKVTL